MQLESGAPKYYNTAEEPERRHKMIMLGRVLAVAAVLLGILMLVDLFILIPNRETVTVAGKYVTHGRHGSTQYGMQFTGPHAYNKQVTYWFYNRCGIGDTVQLSVTPIFREWHSATLMHNDSPDSQITPSATFFVKVFVFISWIPLVLWNRRFCDFMNDALDETPKGGYMNMIIFIFVAIEAYASFLWLKFACVGLGYVGSM